MTLLTEIHQKITSKEFLWLCLFSFLFWLLANYYSTLRHYANWGLLESEKPYMFDVWLITKGALKDVLFYIWSMVIAFSASVCTSLLSKLFPLLKKNPPFFICTLFFSFIFVFFMAHVSSST